MKIPSPGESITEVEISQWLVKDGDVVRKDQTIAELDSDKATLDLPAEASGKITLKAQEGDSMSVGDVVCLIDTSESITEIETDEIESDIEPPARLTRFTFNSLRRSRAEGVITASDGILSSPPPRCNSSISFTL